MGIESNQAASGSNWRIERGILRRRPSFSRIGGRMDRLGWNETATTYNRIHQIVTKRVLGRTEVRLVGEGGIFNVFTPSTSMIVGGVYRARDTAPYALEPWIKSSYTAGTVALISGSPTVTGTGTAWLTRGVHSGAAFYLGSSTYTVRSVDSETSIRLASNSTTTTSGAAYRTQLYGSADWTAFTSSEFERHMGVYPDPSPIHAGMVRNDLRSYYSCGGGTIGGLGQSIGEDPYYQYTYGALKTGRFVNPGTWQRILGDGTLSKESAGLYLCSARKKYFAVGTTSVAAGYAFSERIRFATQVAPATTVVATAPFSFFQDSSYFTCRIFDTIGPGTVSVQAGSPTVTGVGTSFGAGGGVIVGDELVVGYRRYQIASVGSATTLRISCPFDAATVSAGSYGTMSWRGISSTHDPTQTLASGTLSAAAPNVGGVVAHFFPVWRDATRTDGTALRRIGYAIAELTNPWFDMWQDPSRYSSFQYLLVCAADVDARVRHNLWWDSGQSFEAGLYPQAYGHPISHSIIPLSMVAPNARLIEWWNGRVFAADLHVVLYGTDAGTDTLDRQPLGIAWTRVNEPFSWWNQYAMDGAGNDIVTNGSGEMKALKVLTSQNVMAVYREHGITVYYPTGDAISPFGTQYRDLGPGPVADDAILEVPDGHLFLGLDGKLHLFNGSTMVEFPCTVLDYIRDNLTWAQAHWVQAVWEKNKGEYMWFIPTTTVQGLTAAIVYNTTYGIWYIYEFEDTPLSCVAYIDTVDNSTERRLWAVTNDCHLVAFRDEAQGGLGFDFIASVGGGTAFSTAWESKDLALPVPETDSESRVKLLDSVELLYDADPDLGGTVTVSVSPDGGETWTSFGNASLRPGTTAGTRSTLCGGAQVPSVYHRVRIVQTPGNFNVRHSMAVKAVKIHYVDFGEATP